jgi:hypothetical protein
MLQKSKMQIPISSIRKSSQNLIAPMRKAQIMLARDKASSQHQPSGLTANRSRGELSETFVARFINVSREMRH